MIIAPLIRECVRTASGSDRIRKNREFISARFAVILLREVSLLMRGGFLIRSLPLAVLTHPPAARSNNYSFFVNTAVAITALLLKFV